MAHDYIQEFYRWRLDEDDVNSEASGWLAAENTDIIYGTGIHVRLRIKLRETGVGGDSISHKLQVKLNPGVWVDVQQDGPNVVGGTSPVLLIASPNFSDAATITTEYLTSTVGNINGEGIAPVQGPTNVVTASYAPNNQEIEFEWNLKIMSFHDNFIQVVENDLLQFRMVESDGTLYSSYDAIPEITATETDYYVGGTIAETPDRLLASDSNGNIYYFMEPAESTQDIICIKSTNGGKTWREMDGIHRPANDDMESGDLQVVGDSIHLGIQHNNDAYYHRFHMSDHLTKPDIWIFTDEPVQTSVTRDDQIAAIVVRSDETIVQFWQEIVSGDIRVRYKIRSVGGVWGSAIDVDSTASTEFGGVVAVLGASDKTHIFYSDITNSNLLHKALTSGDVLDASPDIAYSDFGGSSNDRRNMTNPVYWDDAGDEKIMIGVLDQSEEKLYSVLYTNDGAPDTADALSDHTVENNSGGNHMVIAHMAVESDIVYCVYGRLSSPYGIWVDKNDNDGGWGTDTEIVSDKVLDWILCSVIQQSSGNGGDLVVGFIYDDGSNGGCGNQWYSEYIITAAPTTGSAVLNGIGSIIPTAQVEHHASVDLQPFGDLVAEGFAIKVFGATLSGSGSLSGSAKAIRSATVTLSGIGAFTAIGRLASFQGETTLSGIGSLIGVSEVIHQATINLSGISSLTSSGYLDTPPRATLGGVATLTAIKSIDLNSGAVFTGLAFLDANAISFSDDLAQAILPGTSELILNAEVGGLPNSGAILSGIGTLAGIPEAAKFADAALNGIATLVFTPIVDWVTGAVLVGDSGIRPIGRRSPPGKIILTGVANLTAAYSTLLPARLSLLGEGSWSPKPIAIHRASVSFAGVGSIIPHGIKSEESGAILAGSSSISGIGVAGIHARAMLDGAGTVTGTIEVLIGGKVLLKAIAIIQGDPSAIFVTGSLLKGAGRIFITAKGLKYGSAVLSGIGQVAFTVDVTHSALLILDGIGSLISFARSTLISGSQLDGSSTFTSIALMARAGTVSLVGAGTFAVGGRVEHGGFTNLSGAASLVAAASRLRSVTTSLDGIADLFADGAVSYGGVLSFAGSATFAGAGTYQLRSGSQFDGVGLLVSDGLVSRGSTALLSGESSTIGEVTMTWGGAALLAGVTNIDPTARVIDVLPVAFSDITKFGDDIDLIKIGSTDALTKVK